MKTNRRRTEIRIETHEVKVIRFVKDRSTALCRECGRHVLVIPVEDAAEAMDLVLPDVVTLHEKRCFHSIGDNSTISLVCLDSFDREKL